MKACPPDSRWPDAQRAHVVALYELLPERPWWLLIKNPKAPARCSATDGLLMHYQHTTWRSVLPPCQLAGCNCTVWALTPTEAWYHHRLRPDLWSGLTTNCRTCHYWTPDNCARGHKDFLTVRNCGDWEREPGTDC